MKRIYTLIPVALLSAVCASVVLNPGRTYAEPRVIAAGKTAAVAEAATYTIDPQHTSLYFEITHLGLSKTHGRINKFSGKVYADPNAPQKSTVELTAQVDSIDTAVPERDTHLKSADFFDVAKYPELTFKSTKLAKTKDGYTLTGDLTIKGKTKSVLIPFKQYGPLSLKGVGDDSTRIGIVAEPITIKRSDFGVGADMKLPNGAEGVSDAVIVRISLEATLDK
jgi:polyisoprenoid-binding protein YceI